MKRINRWLIALLAIACLMSIVACKKDQTENGGNDDSFYFEVDGVKAYPAGRASYVLTALESRKPAVSAKGSCLGGVDGDDVNYVYAGFRIQTFRLSEGDPNEEIRWIIFTDDSVKTAEGIAIGASADAVKETYGTPAEETGSTLIYRRGKTELRFDTRDGAVNGISYTVSES